MFTAYDKLKEVTDTNKITKITLTELKLELDVNKTLELMKEL